MLRSDLDHGTRPDINLGCLDSLTFFEKHKNDSDDLCLSKQNTFEKYAGNITGTSRKAGQDSIKAASILLKLLKFAILMYILD